MTTNNSNVLNYALALLIGFTIFALPHPALSQNIEDGSQEHPFLIENLQELKDFHECMIPGNAFYFYNGTYQTAKPAGTEGVDYRKIPQGCKGKYIKLTCDIVVNTGNVAGCDGVKDSSWTAWTPMEIFYGNFDGNYHIVSGLYCTTRDSANNSRHERGFFTQISDSAKVMRLGITNSYIAGARAVGGITGWMLNKSEVSECFFEGTLVSTDINTGGIVGIAEQESQISNCYSSGSIYASSHYVGGIVGYISGGATVRNCYSTMIVSSDGILTGAITGYNDAANIENCFYDKQLSTLNTDASYATGMLTREMTTSSWTALGVKFEYADNYYPRIKGFAMSQPSVAMSVIPFFLNAVSPSQYDIVTNLVNDFTLGTHSGASWSVESWNNCITLSGLNAHLEKQGVADLMVQIDTLSRTYILYPNIAPFLGSESNPFTINNLEDLTNFRNGINKGIDFKYKRINIIYDNLPNTHWLQTADINLALVPNWTPIGTSEYPFSGHFNGGNHELLNLTISGSEKALFCHIDRAVVKNTGIVGLTLTNASGSAGLCVNMHNSTIDNCFSTGTVRGSSPVAGLVAYAKSGYDTIRNCRNYCNVEGTDHGVGGVLAYCQNDATLYMRECHNYGNITGNCEGIGGICA